MIVKDAEAYDFNDWYFLKALSYIFSPRRAAAALVLALAAWQAPAAELGEPMLKSYLGQPLIADIELLQFNDDDWANLNVRLARADVYKMSGVAMDPVLSAVHMSVMRRDGRMFLHVTSVKPVQASYLHLYLEMNNGKQQMVRLATLWFEQDPRPPAPAVPPEPAQALSDEPPSPALQAAMERARRQQTLPKLAEDSGSCSRSARSCAILATKNAELNAQVASLEGKVKALQTALGVDAAASASASAEAHGSASASASAVEHASAAASGHDSASAHAAASAKASKPGKVEKKGPQTDWVLLGSIGGGVLALAGGVWFFLRRRKKAKDAKGEPAEAKPGLMAKVLGLLRRKQHKGKDNAPEQHEEPSLDS